MPEEPEKYELEFISENSSKEEDASRTKAKIDEIDNYIETVYAKDVYAYYSQKKPKLIRKKTNEVVSWEDAFGDDFEKISKPLRHSLVALVDGDGRYKFI
ncbi:hypothetical protein [Butyrivibrio sp. INlla16]|uniref:hypothetical protein n=1 Tax=Butyrivibrio sp. INlla16 TaxID=1520807 RepID=UPI000882E7EA|nr:hypothetical protein [Butyrivibrio sp. INlla16]SDB69212.1 hypothetical protein SAMN02910263_04397 [Butyrivibrio sp. INlla16]